MAKELDIEKIIKKAKDEFSKETKRHVDAMFEVFDDKIEAVAEQYNDIKNTLDSHTEEIGNLTMDMMEVKSDVKTIKFEMVAVMNTKADRKHIVELDRRIRSLEKK